MKAGFFGRVIARAERIERERIINTPITSIMDYGPTAMAKPKPKAAAPSNPLAQWHAAIQAELPACGGNRQRAASVVARRPPELRQAIIAQANPQVR